MRVENISLIQNRNSNQSPAPQVKTIGDGQVLSAPQTSIYKQKGVTIPFGVWAKGANEAEEACIKMFRKVREHRCRKYTEPEIIDFMKELSSVPPENKVDGIVNELFMTYKICHEEFGAELAHPVPDAKFVKNYLKVAKNCSEDERLGLIGFTQHELCNGATEPLGALAKATPEQQKRFVKIMNDISFDACDSGKSEVLYEDLRHVIYATEDLPKLDAEGKLQYLSDVQFDYNRLKTSQNVPQKVLGIAKDIVETMIDVLQI